MILVSGSTGTIGSELVKQLSAAQVPARALVRSAAKASALRLPGIELVEGDLEDEASLARALAGVDRFFLLSSGSPRQHEVQAKAIDVAKRAGVKHVVKLSALGAAKETPSGFGRWHYATEEHLRTSGLAWTILQPHSFMQNLLGSAATIVADGALYAPVKDARVAMIDARDIAASALAVLTRPGHEGQTYVLTGGEAVTYAEVAEALTKAAGHTIKYVDVPPQAAKQGMVAGGVPEWLADELLVLFGFFSTGGGAATTPWVKTLTGREPRRIGDFARDYAAAFTRR